MKDNAKRVVEYLQNSKGKNITANDIALALGLTTRQVDGIFTMALQKQGLGVRTPAQVADENGVYKDVKYLSLTDAGYLMKLD